MFTIEATTAIDAPPEGVWAVLTDAGGYADWRSMLHVVESTFGPDARPTLRLELPGGPSYAFRPTVMAFEPPRRLTWRAVTGVRGLFDDTHTFALTPLGADRTRLVNREVYSGLLTPTMRRLPMLRDAQPNFDAMNAEIKA
ncbi:MAG: SRPBCC domain-containing protein [Bacteroidetes bacterium]|jgi:hypothetical protein|nr:SRPBCC domain-containing protein [Bacteroidota bacterium]